ncbi:MAG: hypothetical protein GX576_12380 [Thauera phenolivorans]|uniref:Uncharacterized protein n=1 Tax=Thauera phenolivorans TaxID=1792543 RepID=A0A7X7R907_9RHOO|nr:hypothetical protein [Thauera phenolivorans]NLF55169.1 hypothetical protein [Thauera phenolivorans]
MNLKRIPFLRAFDPSERRHPAFLLPEGVLEAYACLDLDVQTACRSLLDEGAERALQLRQAFLRRTAN